MSCRTTPSGSAFTTFARLAASNEVSDVSTLSAFHRLRREYTDQSQLSDYRAQALAASTTPEHYQALVANLRERVTADTSLSDARRASLLSRLDAAATAETPDGGTVYALRNIVAAMDSEGSSRARFLRAYATEMSVTVEEAAARWDALENGIDRSRSAADPETVTTESTLAARQDGISAEAGSVHAYTTMRAEAGRAESARLEVIPRRVTRAEIAGTQGHQLGDGATIRVIDAGHDPRTQYAEITVENVTTGERTTHAYHHVYDSDIARMTSNPAEASQYWASRFRGATWMQFRDPREAERAAAAPRCALCGQFSTVGHGCPVAATTPIATFRMSGDYRNRQQTSPQRIPSTWSDPDGNVYTGQTRIDLPLVTPMRDAGRNGGLLIESINETIYLPGSRWDTPGVRGTLTGDLAMVLDENGVAEFRSRELQCNCEAYQANYRCEHVDTYIRAVRTRLNPPARTPAAALTPEQRAERTAAAQARAEAAALTDWTRNEETLAEARRTWQQNAEVSYSDDFDTFERHYNEALAEVAGKNGAAAVPYLRENALGGMATRASGQAFGMEIEYEFPADWAMQQRTDANAAIGRALAAANLTDSPVQKGYHAGAQAGYIDKHVNPDTGKGTWSWERDGSVSGGELVTPGMYDEPETWTKLEQAVSILKANGAIATTKAGAHVHVGTGMYAGDPKKYGELAQMMVQHEDIMFRLAQNPDRKAHRQGNYTMPMPEAPSGGWRDLTHVKNWQGGRTRVLNFNGVATPISAAAEAEGWGPGAAARHAKDHPEFRIFDSTLDVGVMQAQAKLAVAMTHAASRNAELGGTSRPKEHLGAHLERVVRRRRNPTRDDVIAETASFRSMMDTLFTREVDKKQLTSLFAATKWVKPDAGNVRLRRRDVAQAEQLRQREDHFAARVAADQARRAAEQGTPQPF